jgi:hypothetical protein
LHFFPNIPIANGALSNRFRFVNKNFETLPIFEAKVKMERGYGTKLFKTEIALVVHYANMVY